MKPAFLSQPEAEKASAPDRVPRHLKELRLRTGRPSLGVMKQKLSAPDGAKLAGVRAKALAPDGAAAPWGAGASLGSAVPGSDERPQHIPVLLAPAPQGTTSFVRVGVVASIRAEPRKRVFRRAGLAPLPLPVRNSGASPALRGQSSRNDRRHARKPIPGTKLPSQRAERRGSAGVWRKQHTDVLRSAVGGRTPEPADAPYPRTAAAPAEADPTRRLCFCFCSCSCFCSCGSCVSTPPSSEKNQKRTPDASQRGFF